jgi:hypothetical protein
VKKSVDTEILKKTLAKYFMVFDLTIVPIYDLDGQTKDNIFHLITSFVDNFYYDDDTGLSLFGKKIADFKGSKNYKEIIKSDISNNIVTPVREKSGLGEQLNLNSWKNLAQ